MFTYHGFSTTKGTKGTKNTKTTDECGWTTDIFLKPRKTRKGTKNTKTTDDTDGLG